MSFSYHSVNVLDIWFDLRLIKIDSCSALPRVMWDLHTVASIATLLLFGLSIICYTIFQWYYFSRAPVQRTVVNTLVVNLSFLLEFLNLILCSTVLLPYILPVFNILTQYPLIGCIEVSFCSLARF